MGDQYLGEIHIFANDYAIQEWAICNGDKLPVGSYQALYYIIQNRFGGDTMNFALPNISGRAVLHPGSGQYYYYQQAGIYGEETTALTAANVPYHKHTMHGYNSTASSAIPQNGSWFAKGRDDVTGTEGIYPYYAAPANNDLVDLHSTSMSTFGATSPLAHDNMQPYLSLLYLIALEGVFPCRPN